MFDVNLVAVLAVAILNIIIGMLWFSPMLFGDVWLKMLGKKKNDMKKMQKDAAKAYPFAFVGALITTYVLAVFINIANANTLGDGALIGLLAWVGFMATANLNSVLWGDKSKELFLFNNAHMLFVMIVSGAILAIW